MRVWEGEIKMLWFEYKKETNIFCVATFSVALLNIVLNIIFLDRYFNDTRELFQDSGLNYGHVALCNSLIILSISTLLILGCDNFQNLCILQKRRYT